MSKNTSSSNFRKTNVDQYDEDNYEDEDTQGDASGDAKAREAECKKLLAAYPFEAALDEEALKTALSSSPQLVKDKAVKDSYARTVLNVLSSFKMDDVPKAVANLSQTQVDMLMKYVYRGMGEVPPATATEDAREEFGKLCGILLAFHTAAVAASGGLGCVVRVLTERKTV